mgnify:CR=1 FL=1|jgi:DNA replication protein DnaD|nr:hypothetical protein [Pelagibacteraceae bacterium]
MNSIFINAIRKIRVENDLVHFELGENRLSKEGNLDEFTALNATMSKTEFVNMIGYLDHFINTNLLHKRTEKISKSKETKKVANRKKLPINKKIKISSTK